MYGYEEYIDNLLPEHILQRVTQEQIFEFVLQQSFHPDKKYKAPYREDNHAGCNFGIREDGTILFQDFTQPKGYTHKSCFRVIMDTYGVNLTEAVHIIVRHFDLPREISAYNSNILPSVIPRSRYINEKDEDRPKSIIEYDKIDYRKVDKLHWSKFIITVDDLFEDNVFATNRVTIFRENVRKSFPIYGLGYAIDFLDAVKIYQPYSETHKFITSCTENHIGNIDNIPATGEVLVIAKSYKDHRVIRNLVPDLPVIWFQSESEKALPHRDILESLLGRYDTIIIFYDNDIPGIVGAHRLNVALYNIIAGKSRIVKIPLSMADKFKDISSYVEREGRKDTLKLLKQIKLIE